MKWISILVIGVLSSISSTTASTTTAATSTSTVTPIKPSITTEAVIPSGNHGNSAVTVQDQPVVLENTNKGGRRKNLVATSFAPSSKGSGNAELPTAVGNGLTTSNAVQPNNLNSLTGEYNTNDSSAVSDGAGISNTKPEDMMNKQTNSAGTRPSVDLSSGPVEPGNETTNDSFPNGGKDDNKAMSASEGTISTDVNDGTGTGETALPVTANLSAKTTNSAVEQKRGEPLPATDPGKLIINNTVAENKDVMAADVNTVDSVPVRNNNNMTNNNKGAEETAGLVVDVPVLPLDSPRTGSPVQRQPQSSTISVSNGSSRNESGTPVPSAAPDSQLSEPRRIPEGCNVKNATCVPTRDELIAAGATNVDFVQHKVTFDRELLRIGQEMIEGTTEKVLKSTEIMSTSTQTSADVTTTTTSVVSSDIPNRAVPASTQTHSTSTPTKTSTPSQPVSLPGVQQIPGPGTTTLQSAVDDKTTPTAESPVAQSTAADGGSTSQEPVQNLQTASTKVNPSTAEIQPSCPKLDCTVTCLHGWEVDSKGCETCTCKYSENCPRVLPASRLLCLLRIRTGLTCETDADCKRNRICCPGTCGPICRRESRNRSMMLSMLVD